MYQNSHQSHLPIYMVIYGKPGQLKFNDIDYPVNYHMRFGVNFGA